ncbi:MAG: hypothetical protein J7L46_04045, partial [Bacteroidales bacterium]|nr:hypothetical protein [Bacteroidales bacterium]
MCRRVILIFFVSLIAGKIYGQDTLSYPVIDRLTYKYYTNKKWDNLIKLGKKSLHKNIDFYYLRVRMGVAHFEKHRYLKAIIFLEKAYEVDKKNTVVQEYLYWSYYYSYLYNEADKLYENLDHTVKTKINYQTHFIQVMALKYGYGKNQNLNTLSGEKLLTDNDQHSEREVLNDEQLFGIGLLHPAGSGVFITQNLSFFTLNYQKNIDDSSDGKKQIDLKTSQKQYYFQTSIPLGKRWLLSPALSLLWGYTQNYELFFPRQPFMPPRMEVVNKNFINILLSGTINKTWSLWENQTNFSIGNFDKKGSLQAGNKVSFFPLQNKKIIISGDIQVSADTNRKTVFVKTVSLSTNLKHFSIYGFYT